MSIFSFFFFFNDTATTEIYTLSLHDALPISTLVATVGTEPFAIYHFHHLVLYSPLANVIAVPISAMWTLPWGVVDRKSTRLNSSHSQISYAVFCLKKKKKK